MTDDVDQLMSSPDWEARVRAVQVLRRRQAPGDVERLRTLLHDQDDKAVIYEAAPALFDAGERGWAAALESVWWDGVEDNSITLAAYEALALRYLDDDEDVEARLRDFVDHPRNDDSRRGAMKMLVNLRMARAADFAEDEW